MRYFDTPDGAFYVHPSGFKIKRDVRDWDGRGYRGTMAGDPKVQWLVYGRDRKLRADAPTFRTLRAAKAWVERVTDER